MSCTSLDGKMESEGLGHLRGHVLSPCRKGRQIPAQILWKCVFKFEVVSVNPFVDFKETIKVMHGTKKCGFDCRCGMCVPIK